jgi:hypothetical protein
MVYKRRLRQSEAERYFIYVEASSRDMFPKQHVRFNLMFKGKPFDVEIDDSWRIWVNYLWDKLPSFKECDIIIFEQNKDGSFNISVEP